MPWSRYYSIRTHIIWKNSSMQRYQVPDTQRVHRVSGPIWFLNRISFHSMEDPMSGHVIETQCVMIKTCKSPYFCRFAEYHGVPLMNATPLPSLGSKVCRPYSRSFELSFCVGQDTPMSHRQVHLVFLSHPSGSSVHLTNVRGSF